MGVLPDVPTLSESLPGYKVVNWYGIVLPAGSPKEAVSRLNSDISKVLTLPEIKERMLAMATEPVSSTPEEFSAFIKSESQKWSKIIRDNNIRVE